MRLMNFRAAAGIVLGLIFSQGAQAAPALILLEDNGSSNPVQRQVLSNLGAVIVTNNVGRIYDHIDVLSGVDATREALFAQIRKRGLKRDVDVVILTQGLNGQLSLSQGNITEQDILSAGPFPRLRLVYMMAAHSVALQSAWLDAGARTVVAHQDFNNLSGFFFPRFLRRWSEGATARMAAAEAYRFSEGTAALLSDYLKADRDLLASVGVARSEPVVAGVDLDRLGRTYPEHSLAIAPANTAEQASQLDSLVAKPSMSHSHNDFSRTSLALLGVMIPQASLRVDAIPSAQKLVDRVSGVAWDQLRDSFPTPSFRAETDMIPGLDLPTKDGEQIWIDGEALRYLLGSAAGFAGEKLAPVLERIQGLRLTRQGDALNAAVYFDRSFTIKLQDKKKIPSWQPYEVHVPKTIRFAIRMLDGVLMLSGLDQGVDAVNLKLKMPFLPDTVWVRSASVSMDDGKVRVEAGVIHNLITVIARAEIVARKFSGVDVWDSIKRNLALFIWPVLLFERQ